MNEHTGPWKVEHRGSGFTQWEELYLEPEPRSIPVLDDYLLEGGADQIRTYADYFQRKDEGLWLANAVPIYWSVRSAQGRVFESAPFQTLPWLTSDFLDYFTWPENASHRLLDWYRLPVRFERFPAFWEALGWSPSPLQDFMPLRAIMASRQGLRLKAVRG